MTETPSGADRPPRRPTIGVKFTCCQVYAHIYLNKQGTAFAGHCPKCARPVRVLVGPGGSDAKIWEA